MFTAGGTNNNQQPTQWNWGTQSVPPSDDFSNVYSYATLNAAGDLVVYAGLERPAGGVSHIDIQFLQQPVGLDEAPPCDNEPCQFVGQKTVGDLLVAMDFSNGGVFGTLRIFVWNGTSFAFVTTAGGEGCNAASPTPTATPSPKRRPQTPSAASTTTARPTMAGPGPTMTTRETS